MRKSVMTTPKAKAWLYLHTGRARDWAFVFYPEIFV